MPRQERAVATRRTILLAAAEVFARAGYEAASIAEILDRAGATKGALYFHFPSKEELAVAVMNEQQAWLDDQSEPAGTPLQRLVGLSYSFCRALQDDPLVQAAIRLTVERATFTAGPIRTQLYGVWRERSETAMTQARDIGQLEPGCRPARLARLVVACVTGLQLASEAVTGRADLLERVEDFWVLFAAAVVVPDYEPALRLTPPRG